MVDAIVSVVVTLFTEPKPVEELQGLVYGMANERGAHIEARTQAWYRQPWLLGGRRARPRPSLLSLLFI